MGLVGTPKISQIGLDLIFFQAGFKFFLAGIIFFPAGLFLAQIYFFDPTSDLKNDPTDTFFALFCPFFAPFGPTSYLNNDPNVPFMWIFRPFLTLFCPQMTQLTNYLYFWSVFGPFLAPFWLSCGGYFIFQRQTLANQHDLRNVAVSKWGLLLKICLRNGNSFHS